MYYKLVQACAANWGSFIITNLGNFVKNQGSYYKLRQPLLQNRAAITNCGKMYYKLGQVLQIRTIITNWGITAYVVQLSLIHELSYQTFEYVFNICVEDQFPINLYSKQLFTFPIFQSFFICFHFRLIILIHDLVVFVRISFHLVNYELFKKVF